MKDYYADKKKNKKNPQDIKHKLHRIIIKHLVTYGSKSWCISKMLKKIISSEDINLIR